MNPSSRIVVGVGLADRVHKSHWPARLDLLQEVSGLLLVLFMLGHMVLVSSILVSRDAMWSVTKFFEGYFFFARPHPGSFPRSSPP